MAHPRADELFADALEILPDDRRAFVNLQAHGDSALAQEVNRLLAAYDSIGDFLQVRDEPRERLIGRCSVGEIVDNNFEIRAVLGSGGMGEVYLAFDHRSREHVALKFIRQELGADAAMSERLRREVQVRALAHPNICPAYSLHYSEAGDRLFLSMKYLPGITLSQMLRLRGKPSREQTLGILRGISSGLDAAHKAGIVHRDLKPANVMLVTQPGGEPVPVIMDFGLVQAGASQDGVDLPDATRLTTILGSPNYMAPEQFLGATVTPAADIFALGVIAFELAAGFPPFPNEDILRAAARRQHAFVFPPGELAIPPSWRVAIGCALDPDPAKRPRDAQAFVAGMQAQPGTLSKFRPPSRRQVVTLSGALSLLSFLAAAFRFKGRAPKLPPVIMLTSVTYSGTPANELAETARIADLLLTTQLSQSPTLALLRPDQISHAWQRMRKPSDSAQVPGNLEVEDARQIALRCGCRQVLYGNLAHSGPEYVLRLSLEFLGERVTSNVSSTAKEFACRTPRDLLSILNDAASWVRSKAGETDDSLYRHAVPVEDLTTPSWEALKAFCAADIAWKNSRDTAEATRLLTQATEIDGEFAGAYVRLADIQMANGQPDEAFTQYTKASAIITSRRLSDRESLHAQGMFYFDTGYCRKAADVFAGYCKQYPADPVGLFYQSAALCRLGNRERAATLLDRAIAMEPDNRFFWLQRVSFDLEQNLLTRAQQGLERARSLGEDGWIEQFSMALAFARGDLAAAARAVEPLTLSHEVDFQSKYHALKACLFAENGRADEAEAALRRGIAFDIRNGLPISASLTKQRLLAQLYLSQRNLPMTLCVCGQILRRTTGRIVTLQAASILAQSNEIALAKKAVCSPRAVALELAGRCPSTDGEADFAEAPLKRPACEGNPADWPVLSYWQKRFDIDIALASHKVDIALRVASTLREEDLFLAYPDYLIRIALAQGDRAKVRTWAKKLSTTPAFWWKEPERSAPGFFHATQTFL